MIRGSITEPRRKPNHDDVIRGFFLSVKSAVLGTYPVSAAFDDRTLSFHSLEMEETRSEWFPNYKSRI
ncbi:hypothetical protein CEXT_300421 [Caerostris extrusa]|uniref:Uncharacterized protein n=1 Tax=Caerostris extrusa TaxID=172846 RepID=A0AAV4NRG7_CAEEX|nr:hypothetical protein CEXT_300421 [Caerostris extrusa]